MATVFRAPLWSAVRTRKEAVVRVGKRRPLRSEPVRETALRRVGDYRCYRGGTYCTPRIYAGPGIALVGGRGRASADRCHRWLAGWSWRAVGDAHPRLNTDVTDRGPRTPAELEVRRVYEPNRLAAVYMSAAYAQVVPRRQRAARSSWSSASTSVSRVVDVRPEVGDAGARCAG